MTVLALDDKLSANGRGTGHECQILNVWSPVISLESVKLSISSFV